MDDTLDLIRERLEKMERRIQRLNKSLESAKKEQNDLDTTLRVLTGMQGGESPQRDNSTTMGRQFEIVHLLPKGEQGAASPVKLFEAYQFTGSESISVDTFRTTLWRMKGGLYTINDVEWRVEGDNGLYWRSPTAIDPMGFPTTPRPFNTDEDVDVVPF